MGSAECTQQIPARWSNSNVECPAIILTPDNEQDILKALEYAREHSLTVIPAGGATGAFVPVTKDTLYLNMERFDKIDLDESKHIVTIGGGVLVGPLLRHLARRGYYTIYPSSNAIGMAGFVLGGGGHHFIGLHGLAIDNVVSFRLITSRGTCLELDASSQENNGSLFQALRGAGFGFGVVTSFQMKVYPLSNLQMRDNQISIRRLVFEGSSILLAAKAFASFKRPPARLLVSMVIIRAPASAPAPGTPLVILDAMYTGPEADANRHFSPLDRTEFVSGATVAQTLLEPFENINDAAEPGNTRGNFKDLNVVPMAECSIEAIEDAYNCWLKFTDENDAAQRSFLAISRFDTTFSEQAGKAGGGFNETRDRSTAFIVRTEFTKLGLKEEVESFVRRVTAAVRRDDHMSMKTVVNNMRPHTKLQELFSDAQVVELRRVKTMWDPENRFWCPWLRDE